MFKPVEKEFDLVAFEHEMLRFWDESKAFEKLREKNAGKPKWSFLDGPITANNPMGVHHAWGRTLKDAFQRYHAMTGHDLRYQNGFDCQGLWVEVEVERELGFQSKTDIEEYGLDRFVNQCKDRVRKYSDIQTEQSIRLGYWMDWSDSYYTMSDENNYTIWTFLRRCHDRGLIYKGLDAMPWCPRCGTGISEQEAKEGYKEIEDQAVYLRFPLHGRENEYLLVWTTTPWTLLANVAAAVHPELTYAKVKQDGDVYWLSSSLVDLLKEKGPYEVVGQAKGAELVGLTYDGPFDDLPRPGTAKEAHRVIAWDEVSDAEGTGIVHIAPGCGKEDFLLGKELGLPVIAPIDETGHFTEGFGFVTGKFASDVPEDVLDGLRERGRYYKKGRILHRYPHCWRCKTKLLFRAVDEWFIRMDWRDEIKEVAKQIRWMPEYGLDLELDWLNNMGDWMISKKRYWGLALPIYECGECGTFEVIGSRQELAERAVEGWDDFDGHSPHRPWIDAVKIACGKCGKPVSRIPDVGNPWLDAGIVPYSTVRYNTDREYWEKWIPADLVLECFPGQFRNWFYALLAMSTMMEGIPPFRTLLGHALVKDEEGKDMHKSEGNAIWFDEAAGKMGVDAMRWLYCRQNPTLNLNFGYGVADQIKRRVFNTWWNVYSFFVSYAIADEFDPKTPPVPVAERQDMDRWLLAKLTSLVRTGRESLSTYDAPALVRAAEEFVDGLSTWYVRRCRRRFWRPKSSDDRDKLAAYQTLYEALVTLAKVLAPVTPFLAEKMYQNLVRAVDPEAPESVHHTDYPEFDASLDDPTLAEEMDAALKIVSLALSVRESKSIRVRQPLSEMVVVSAAPAPRRAAERFRDHVLEELNVKDLRVAETTAAFAEYSVQPDGRLLGPKYGRDLGAIRTALAAMDPGAVAKAVSAGEKVAVEAGGRTFELLPEEVMVKESFPERFATGEDRGLVVLLDTTITPELLREGFARDVVRHVQTMRRDLDLDLTDRIVVTYATEDETLAAAVEEHADSIRGETLADRIEAGAAADGREVKLSGLAITLHVAKI